MKYTIYINVWDTHGFLVLLVGSIQTGMSTMIVGHGQVDNYDILETVSNGRSTAEGSFKQGIEHPTILALF